MSFIIGFNKVFYNFKTSTYNLKKEKKTKVTKKTYIKECYENLF